jgi:hypothetical protein
MTSLSGGVAGAMDGCALIVRHDDPEYHLRHVAVPL